MATGMTISTITMIISNITVKLRMSSLLVRSAFRGGGAGAVLGGLGYPYGYYGGYNYCYYGSGYAYGGSSRSRVADLQRRLARAGYYHGSIDGGLGIADATSDSRVRAEPQLGQLSQFLPVTGDI